MLKQKAMERITGFERPLDRVGRHALGNDAIIAAQAAELGSIVSVLRENGLVPKFDI